MGRLIRPAPAPAENHQMKTSRTKIPTSFNCSHLINLKSNANHESKSKSDKSNNKRSAIATGRFNKNIVNTSTARENDSNNKNPSITEEEDNNVNKAIGEYNFQEAIDRIIRASQCVDDSDQRKDETGSKLKVKTKVKTSKPEEQSEDNDNPSLILADQIQSSPVTSNGTTN